MNRAPMTRTEMYQTIENIRARHVPFLSHASKDICKDNDTGRNIYMVYCRCSLPFSGASAHIDGGSWREKYLWFPDYVEFLETCLVLRDIDAMMEKLKAIRVPDSVIIGETYPLVTTRHLQAV